jgi:16S rRNA (adenine1518-N6/adenine1519-N6)-dimethyltransferase
MRLSEIKQVLASGEIRLTRSLGQNFLHDGNQLRRIIEAADLKPTDKVLEIGAGLGPLTELLVENAGHVLAIEKDRRLVEILRQRLATATNLELLRDDALDYVRREPKNWSGWKLVANLPYSVASPILIALGQAKEGPQRMVATLQLEVAERLMAKPGGKDYGVLTLLVQLRYQPRSWFRISASCFFPAPDVDSACVTLVRRPEPLLGDEQAGTFAKIVKRAFSQRRKMMLKLLKQDWTQDRLARAFEEVGLSSRVRAEDVNLERFVRLTRLLI